MSDDGDLDLRWRTLRPGSADRLSTERVRDWAGGAVFAAIDAAETRHLLIRLPDGPRTRLPRPVRGLRLTTRRMHPPGGDDATWIDLSCTDNADTRLFTGLCADVLAELPTTGPPDLTAVSAVLDRWRRFWFGDRDGLSRDEQLGLVGELWTLLEWVPTFSVGALAAWQGPDGGRHDFVTDTVSVEVKTAGAATGPVIHRISRLDQLDEPGGGQLYLLSLRAVADPSGTDSLDALLTRTRDVAARTSPSCTGLLHERLNALGIAPDETGRYLEPLRIAGQELYRVSGDFPRLTQATFDPRLPPGVVDITYALDTSACGPWLISSRPRDEHSNPVFRTISSG